ncbi:hypothetical protein [Streptomyces sp. NPDC013457]|uniref:hypothetical protein n=1 Tax=Streptomyces sp. NPDC013457 TaxID=3364866 RepID=UPI00370205D3
MFARYLRGLAASLVPGEGWYGVFAGRDPEGLRACFDGTEIPPWDVVESLLHDLGESASGPQATRARVLHRAAAAAHDRRPGGAEALRGRLEAMERERRYAEARAQELDAALREARGTPDADRIDGELAWSRDDHARATARIADLTSRLAALRPEGAPGSVSGPGTDHGSGSVSGPASGFPSASGPAHASGPASASGARRSGAGPAPDTTPEAAASPPPPPRHGGRRGARGTRGSVGSSRAGRAYRCPRPCPTCRRPARRRAGPGSG